jgi:3'-phosphoadenosine 5'-phosphosulfate sulfotransferase (PAPS reductase)/FAD synthetase
MIFRLTDERDWVQEFEAESPAALAAGVRQIWDQRIAAASREGEATHPAFALRSRTKDIDAWLAQRLAREGATQEQILSWKAQADHQRYLAKRDLGGEGASELRIHVLGSGGWLTLARRAQSGKWTLPAGSPRVARQISQDQARSLFEGAEVTLEHEAKLSGLAGHVSETIRQVQFPRPRLLNPATGGPVVFDLHQRIATALGWSLSDVRSMSLPSLREMVRSVDPALAAEISDVIQRGAHVPGEPYRPRRRNPQDDDYRMEHQAPDAESGAPLFDLTANGIYPNDFYQRMEEYRPHNDSDWDAMGTIGQYRGKPNARVFIYRAVPKGVREIRPGDWVAITKEYARDHGRHASDPSQDMPVLAAKVHARDIVTAGDSFQEWGYVGTVPLVGRVVFRPRPKALTKEERALKIEASFQAAIRPDVERALAEHGGTLSEDEVRDLTNRMWGPRGGPSWSDVWRAAWVIVHGERRQNPAIRLGREFYEAALNDYTDWREKWWREAIQNSVDAGATKVACEAQKNPDETWTISVTDNGGGMTREIITDKFLVLGATTKPASSGAAGGFGKAKELLLMPWVRWTLESQESRLRGAPDENNDFEPLEKPLKGTRLTVVMQSDENLHTTDAQAISFIKKCFLPNVAFTVNGKTIRADLQGQRLIEEIPGKAQVMFAPSAKEKTYRMMIRARGLYMFDRGLKDEVGGHILVELTGPSVRLLSANRDSIRDWELSETINGLANKIASDVTSGTRAKKGLISQVFRGTGKFRSQKMGEDVLKNVGPVSSGAPGEKEAMMEAMLEALLAMARAQKQSQEKGETPREVGPSKIPDSVVVRAAFDHAGANTRAIETAVKQLAWQPDFYVMTASDVTGGFKVTKDFLPQSMAPRVTKLASVWTELCRYVLIQLACDKEFGVGFIFSHRAAATFTLVDGESWLLINPFRDMTKLKDIWSPSKEADLAWLYAAAVHECTHLANGIDDHNESFSSALTHNIARCAKGWRQVRAIEQSIKMGEARVAGHERVGVKAAKAAKGKAAEEPTTLDSLQQIRSDARKAWNQAQRDGIRRRVIDVAAQMTSAAGTPWDDVVGAVTEGGADAYASPEIIQEVRERYAQGNNTRVEIAGEIASRTGGSAGIAAKIVERALDLDQRRENPIDMPDPNEKPMVCTVDAETRRENPAVGPRGPKKPSKRATLRFYVGAPERPAYIIVERALEEGKLSAVLRFTPDMKDVAEKRYSDIKSFDDVGDLIREFGTEHDYGVWQAGREYGFGKEKLEKTLPRAPHPNTSSLLVDASGKLAYDLYVVSFSGGKDSLACLLHLFDLGIPKDRIELWHQSVDGRPGEDERFFDWPVTEDYCRKVAAALGVRIRFQWRIGGFEREMLRDGTQTAPCEFELQPDGLQTGAVGTAGGIAPPKAGAMPRMRFPQLAADLGTRWCSSYLKSDVAKRAFANDPGLEGLRIVELTGERREESANRALYAEVERHSTTSQTKRVDQWRAIIDWREKDVWEIIERYNIRPHPAYYAGFSRVSCMSCIFGNADQWTTVQQLSPRTFEKIAAYEVDFGAFWDSPRGQELLRIEHERKVRAAVARGETPPDWSPRTPGRPMTIHRTKTVREQALGGTSYLDDPTLAPGARAQVAENARAGMEELYTLSPIVTEPWELPVGAYKHSGGPI